VSVMKKTLRRLLDIPEHTRLREGVRNRLLKGPANALIKSSTELSTELASKIMKYLPYPAPERLYVLQHSHGGDLQHGNFSLPIPPEYAENGVHMDGYKTDDWISSGKEDIDNMIGILNRSNFSIQDSNRILDFGCSSGRMIRWLFGLADQCEIWGVDISAPKIFWCQENLMPPFNFATVTILPHLPFEDRYFDFIYCGSVFTHIDDLAEAWLLELKRILRPGGRAYVTVHDKHTADLIINHVEHISADSIIPGWAKHSREQRTRNFRDLLLANDKNNYLKTNDYYKYSLFPNGPECNGFYDIDYLSRHWGRILNILSVTPEAYGYQTAVLMEKSLN
jgi:SAM-dependent methyltransferase